MIRVNLATNEKYQSNQLIRKSIVHDCGVLGHGSETVNFLLDLILLTVDFGQV